MSKRILVTVGPSAISKEVVEFADRLAIKDNTELFVLHVREKGPYIEESEEIFKKFMSVITIKTPNFQLLSPEGIPQDKIIEEANRYNVDLIVMAAHSHNSINEFFLGSVSKYVLHHSKCPVYLYKKNVGLNNTILVPVDFSESCDAVIQIADEYAEKMKASLDFIHVVADIDYYSGWTAHAYGVVAPVESTPAPIDFATTEKKLERYISEKNLKSKYNLKVELGTIYERILEHQQIIGAKLIMVAAHSKSFADRLLYGGNSDRLLQQGNCSLFVYRTDDFK